MATTEGTIWTQVPGTKSPVYLLAPYSRQRQCHAREELTEAQRHKWSRTSAASQQQSRTPGPALPLRALLAHRQSWQ